MTVNSAQPINQSVTSNVSMNIQSMPGGGIDPALTTAAQNVLAKSNYRVAEYLNTYGKSNPAFNTSTSGRLVDSLGNSTITRGFIRRADPGNGGDLSEFTLNFMYNPAQVVRDYVSYMDQAALDPYNTVYDSGNLVAPPSFVNFSFNLVFDRQIEAMDAGNDRGVLVDYDYFDMVVRNVAPRAAGVGTVDNGVMMANPSDIVVVFSKDLSVQGRPTNARVAFTKFDRRMVPTRMEVALTMIITYFGPVGGTYNFDYSQDIKKYEALIPYGKVYTEEYTEEDLYTALRKYQDDQIAKADTSSALAKSVGYFGSKLASAANSLASLAGVTGPSNSTLALATLRSAESRILIGRTYSQAARTGPLSYDCSGLVCKAYEDNGALSLLTGGGISNCAGIYSYGQKTGWTKMNMVLNIGNTSFNNVRQIAQPGDLLLRINKGSGNHIAFVNRWEGNTMWVTHAASTKTGCVTASQSSSYIMGFTHLLRPAAAGGESIGRGGGGGSW